MNEVTGVAAISYGLTKEALLVQLVSKQYSLGTTEFCHPKHCEAFPSAARRAPQAFVRRQSNVPLRCGTLDCCCCGETAAHAGTSTGESS